jgi:poly(ADP-ribose) glycohydrolase ARH3
MATLDQFQGCLLGMSLGDALGAPFEGGILERLLWRAIGLTRQSEMRWTDDTQMTIDLVESFLEQGEIDPDDLAKRFARSYRWSRGYGPAAAKVLKRIARGADWRVANRSVFRDGSYGNGAAMRAPVLGLIFANRPDQLREAARLSAIVTHTHPAGIEGALLLATVTKLAADGCASPAIVQQALAQCTLQEFRSRLEQTLVWLESDADISALEVRRHLGRGIAAHESCVTAVYLALRFRKQLFFDMQTFIAQVGGDVDTIGAMAGAIWGATNGYAKLPTDPLSRLEQRERLESLAATLHRHVAASLADFSR